MPNINRLPIRMNCRGVDVAHPVDRMPEGYFPYLFNARRLVDGRIDARPGYQPLNSPTAVKLFHSIRRLNDVSMVYNANGYTYILGNGTTLMAGPATLPSPIDTGFSGNPLSLLTFRPENSPVSWMYVYDANKQVKVRPDGVLRPIGVVPPKAPTAEYAEPAYVVLEDDSSASGWVAYDSAGSGTVTVGDRTNSSASTITSIVYASGSNGWCCINPSTASSFFWAGERMRVVLNNGGGNQETVVVREIHPAIDSTVVSGIVYDSGSTGLCTVVLAGSPPNIARNSLLQIDAEVVRVLSVTYSNDGTTYSIRCSTTSNHTAGASVTGLVSWFVYTYQTHSATETISANYLAVSVSNTDGAAAKLSTINASLANGRPVSLTDDYLHISLLFVNPQNVTTLEIQIDIDSLTTSVGSSGNAFTRNYLTWTITKDQLNEAGPGGAQGNAWTELVLPLASAQRSGSDLTRTLANIQAIQVKTDTSAATAFGIASWYIFGTYGPVIQPNSPLGYFYETRNRDSSTGAASVPGAQTRYSLFPLREGIVIQPDTTVPTGVDVIDIYRQGGTLTEFTYVGTSFVSGGVPPPFTDTQPDDLLTQGGPDLTLLQPWPVLDTAWQGTVDVNGTMVTWVSGTPFDINLVAGAVITINGVAYQTYGQPISSTQLQIAVDAGVQTAVAYEIASPTLAAQPLPFAFGPLAGPFLPIMFGLGSPINPGFLYYTNAANADAASDANAVEVCPPSEPLINGGVWASIVFCASQDNLYYVRYSFLGNVQQFQVERIPARSGAWNRYACCTGTDGWYYVGRDGIYRATNSGAECITDVQLYPLFPHDGEPASLEHDIYPVDMAQPMYLDACDNDIYFTYVDTNGTNVCLRYEISTQSWWPHYYPNPLTRHYLVERSVSSPDTQEILLLSKALGLIYMVGGDSDAGTPITTIIQTPSYDGGDERSQKLVVDYIADLEGAGTVDLALGFDNNTTYSAITTLTVAALRNQYQVAQDSVPNLALYRNVSLKAAWTGGPAGPKIYAFEPSWYEMPYLSKSVVTQFIRPGIGGWVHHRRLYAALISTATASFVIKCQDGRSYGPYTLPNTSGQLRIWPIMLDQNIKDLAFAYSVTSDDPDAAFALFQDDFVVELKNWTQDKYALVPVFKS